MPCRRDNLLTGSPASACFRIETICCSVNLLFRIGPPFGGLTLYLDQFPGSRSRGLRQSLVQVRQCALQNTYPNHIQQTFRIVVNGHRKLLTSSPRNYTTEGSISLGSNLLSSSLFFLSGSASWSERQRSAW